MNNSMDIEVVGGTTFELRPNNRTPIKKKSVCLRKNRALTNRYLELASEFSLGRIVELGVDQGGSTSFFSKLFQPEKLLAFELSNQPVDTVMQFLAEHDPEGNVEIHWGIDQADRLAIPRIIENTMGNSPLDLVVDDASHLLVPSIASFEVLFPRLRPNGLYILEDWSGDHIVEHNLEQALLSDESGEISRHIEANAHEDVVRSTPMSLLICQITIAAGRNPRWITDVRVTDGYCEVRRGPAEIPNDTPITDYIGRIGTWMFDSLLRET